MSASATTFFLLSAAAPGCTEGAAALELQRFYLEQQLIGRGFARPFMDAVKQAQQSGNFSDYGAALQKLSDAMTKYDNAG